VEPVDLIRDALLNRGISFDDKVINNFRMYQACLLEWNKKINLISKNDEPHIVTKHFLQSIGLLTVVDFPMNSRLLDLGSGGGFPGIPMKIIRSDMDLVLVEATQKKALFLEEIIKILNLKKIITIPKRVESIKNQIVPADFIISRAVADLNSLVRWSMACLKKEEGRWIAIKGKYVNQEVEQLNVDKRVQNMISCEVLPYNPFPELFVLHDSYVVVIKKRNS
jgi:16S rRNA (guanine527-N7)-methyltransferase